MYHGELEATDDGDDDVAEGSLFTETHAAPRPDLLNKDRWLNFCVR